MQDNLLFSVSFLIPYNQHLTASLSGSILYIISRLKLTYSYGYHGILNLKSHLFSNFKFHSFIQSPELTRP